MDEILDRNKSEEAYWLGKIWFRHVKLELVRRVNGNFHQMVRNSRLILKEEDHIRNVFLRVNYFKDNS